MAERRVLCLDVGDRRIGIAVSDPLGITAQPLETYARVGYGPDVRHIAALAGRLGAGRVLCGLPRNMDGSLGAQAEKVRAFAAELQKAGLRVSYWDERLSTVTAERALIQGGMRRERRRQTVDRVAAAVILQAYLDAGSQAHEEPGMTQSEENTMDERLNAPPGDDRDHLVELLDEEGNPALFRHLMTLEHKGSAYIALCGAGEEDGEDEDEVSEVYLLRIDRDKNGEDCYTTIEDEALLQEVFEAFVELAEEEADLEGGK